MSRVRHSRREEDESTARQDTKVKGTKGMGNAKVKEESRAFYLREKVASNKVSPVVRVRLGDQLAQIHRDRRSEHQRRRRRIQERSDSVARLRWMLLGRRIWLEDRFELLVT